MKDWRTTLGGWLFAVLVLLADYLAHKTISPQSILVAAGFAGVGTFAADSKNTPKQ